MNEGLRFILTIVFSVAFLVGSPALGAVVGWNLAFHWAGVPAGPHCGLAVFPAICCGCLGSLVGIFFGAFFGYMIAEAIWEHFPWAPNEGDFSFEE